MLREENLRLQRRLLRETERREQLSRQLSESESSLEMDEERQFNERARFAGSPVSYSPSPTRRSLSSLLSHSFSPTLLYNCTIEEIFSTIFLSHPKMFFCFQNYLVFTDNGLLYILRNL